MSRLIQLSDRAYITCEKVHGEGKGQRFKHQGKLWAGGFLWLTEAVEYESRMKEEFEYQLLLKKMLPKAGELTESELEYLEEIIAG